MARIMILGATGSLGKHVTAQAVAANHEVSVLVRTQIEEVSIDNRHGYPSSLDRNAVHRMTQRLRDLL